MTRPLLNDERELLNRIMLWGSDGYPVTHVKGGWLWSFKTMTSPTTWKTKKAATEAFEKHHDFLLDVLAGRA